MERVHELLVDIINGFTDNSNAPNGSVVNTVRQLRSDNLPTQACVEATIQGQESIQYLLAFMMS